MKYTDISTYDFKAGERIRYIEPNDPSISHLVLVEQVSRPETGTSQTLEVCIIETSDKDAQVGDTFHLTVNPIHGPFIGIVLKEGELVPSSEEIQDTESLIVFSTVMFFKNKNRVKKQATYEEIHTYLKNLKTGLVLDDYKESLKTELQPAFKAHPHLFRRKRGGTVEFVGATKRKESFKNSTDVKVVDIGILTQGFRDFAIAVLKSGILGSVEIKYD